MQRASTHYGCCDAHELSAHGHCGATASSLVAPSLAPPLEARGPLANFYLFQQLLLLV